MWSTIREFFAARKGKEGLTRRLRFVVLAVLAAAALAIGAQRFPPRRCARCSRRARSRRSAGRERTPASTAGIPCYLPCARSSRRTTSRPAAGAPTGAGQTILVVTAYGAPFVDATISARSRRHRRPVSAEPHGRPAADPDPDRARLGSDVLLGRSRPTSTSQWAYAMAPQARTSCSPSRTPTTRSTSRRSCARCCRSIRARSSRRASAWTRPGPASDPDASSSTFSPMYLDVASARRHGARRVRRPRRVERHRARGDVFPSSG